MFDALANGNLGAVMRWRSRRVAVTPAGPVWAALPLVARLYVSTVTVAGACGLVLFFPRTIASPALFAALVVFACLTSAWKVNLPIPIASASATLSVSYAASLMSLLLLGPRQAMIVSLFGVLTQCTYKPKQSHLLHRTLFSCATAVITMIATGAMYVWLEGPVAPFDSSLSLAKPFVGAIATYFLFNTGLIAGAIALSTNRGVIDTWRHDFLWLGASFLAAGTAGALGAIVVARGEHWKALLLAAPIYLIYRTYGVFVGRLEDQKRHMAEMQKLHTRTVTALGQAREAERALASEKEHLTSIVEEMTRLETVRDDLLQREQAARASAEEANRLKDQFLATVSHELRTPLSAILGWADMLQRGMLIEDRMRDRAVSAIYASGKRQAQLIDDLLDVARIMSGKLRLDRTPLNLKCVVRDALQIVQPAADAKGIRIRLNAAPTIGPVSGDGARLQQIAWNLLSNAVKFTPAGGEVDVRIRPVGGDVELVVSDSGQGISPEFLPAVFDPFRQADGSSTRLHGGLGIGLSIVKNLAEAHGGTVSAASAGEGRGAMFTVRLPVAVLPEPSGAVEPVPTLPRPELAETSALLRGLSVLIVDDDAESREVITAYLHASVARIFAAASAAEALEVLMQQHVDVLLADIAMPDEDGYSLIRKVRALNAAIGYIPAAALTAFARDEDRQEALDAGFQLHLAKPIDADSLTAAVAALAREPGRIATPQA